jgi:LysR family glycine cleavage system transcriptional activator
MRKLPSTNLLVTFDAAARHLSFKQAAEELCVTPSAVGHQIRVLEEELNVQLFERLNRSIALTSAGKQYHGKIANALQTLRTATADIVQRNEENSLLIHSFPFLVNTLLAPNLKAFKSLYPNLKIVIESRIDRSAMNSGQLEIAIRHGEPSDETLVYQEVSPILISPVRAPDYQPHDPLTAGVSLIELSSDPGRWDKWQQDCGIQLDVSDTIKCDGMQAVIEMAEQGLGLAMGYFPALEPLVKAGRLKKALPEHCSQIDSLYLVYPKAQQHHPVIQAFSSWFSALMN